MTKWEAAALSSGGEMGERNAVKCRQGSENNVESGESETSDSGRQGAVQQRVPQSQYLAVKNRGKDAREDISRLDSEKFKSVINQVEILQQLVQKPREQVADTEALLESLLGIANTLVTSIKSQSNEGVLSDFISSLLRGFGKQDGEVRTDNAQNLMVWGDIGLAVSHIFRKVPGCCTILGPMFTELKQQMAVDQCKRVRPTESLRHEEVMDCLELLPLYGDETCRRGKNVVWTPKMDRSLINGLLNQIAKGQKVSSGFKEVAYDAVANEVNKQFNLQLVMHHVVNRLRTLKKDYKAVHNMLSKSGFSWNSITKRIEVADEVWGLYVASNPKMKRYKDRSWPLYEQMVEVFSEDHTISQFAQMNRERPKTGEGVSSEGAPSPYIPPAEQLGVDELIMLEDHHHIPDSQSPKYIIQGNSTFNHTNFDKGGNGKRKRASDTFYNLVASVADMIAEVATVIRDRPGVHVKASMLLAAVEEVDGIEQDTLESAFEILVSNPAQARAFMAYSVPARKRFLLRLFSRNSH